MFRKTSKVLLCKSNASECVTGASFARQSMFAKLAHKIQIAATKNEPQKTAARETTGKLNNSNADPALGFDEGGWAQPPNLQQFETSIPTNIVPQDVRMLQLHAMTKCVMLSSR